MKIIDKHINGHIFKLFEISIGHQVLIVAEERLNQYIEKCIENNEYVDEIVDIDSLYSYYIPQEIADTLNEEEIVASIKDVISDYE